MASCTSCISSCVSAAATRPAETGGSTRIVIRLPQLNSAFFLMSVFVPSSTTGRISTPASLASVKAPALKR